MNRLVSLKKKYIKEQVSAVLKLIVLSFATVTVLVVGAWSWFVDDSDANADNVVMTLNTVESLEVSVNDSAFSTRIDLSNDTDILDNLKMRDVTGYKQGFLIPKFKSDIGVSEPNLAVSWDTAVANQDYISLTLRFRTKSQSDIYVASGTKVSTFCENQGAPLNGVDAVNKSAYGDFSRDAIVGALRMNAFDSSGNYKFLWIPRPDIYLEASADYQQYTLYTDLSSDDQRAMETTTHACYPANVNKALYRYNAGSSGIIASETAFTATAYDAASGDSTTKIATTSVKSGDYYVSNPVTLNIWVEGCDAEALRALSGGKYELVLKFVART